MKGKKQMPRYVRTMLAGRSGRRGRGRQSQLGYGRGSGRRMSAKVMAPEPSAFLRPQSGATLRPKTEMSRKQELQAIEEQARAIQTRLRSLDKRIREIEHGFTPSNLKAFVDSDRCVGCGTCLDVCPACAISVEDIAEVDPKRCIGCGSCVEQCPSGAVALHPLNTAYEEQVRVAR